MQSAKTLSVAATALVFAALIANHAFARLNIAPLRLLPVDTFPRVIDDWIAGEDARQDPQIYKKLPTARIVERSYRGPGGREIDVVLLTASSYSDFHDPNWCLPGQGYHISPTQTVTVGGQSARMLTAERGDAHLRVLYWWQGQVNAEVTYGRDVLAKLWAIRSKLTNEQGQTLFVRLVTQDTADGEATLRDFAERQIAPRVHQMLKAPAGS